MSDTLTKPERPKPFLFNQFCKSCSRCIEACARGAITMGTEIDPRTGVTPVVIDLEKCNGCGMCFEACPEPFGLMPRPVNDFDPGVVDPETIFGAKASTATLPVGTPDEFVGLPHTEPMVLKGTHASAVGALLAGCRHFFGYPITPSTEGAELLAKLLPALGGTFVQAVSEVAAVNMMYGAGGAGRRTMTFTSSPGFSLMLEGISYMIGAEVPAVFVNIMRGGPGLGNIAPEQADIKLVCRGLGHGNTHAIVFAPASPQEMLDLTMLSFELAFKYRNPVILVGDGYLGQITGKVQLPEQIVRPGIPEWAVFGDAEHRGNLINSIRLSEAELEVHNEYLNRKYASIKAAEQRADTYLCEDAEWIVIAANTPARMAKGAVEDLRRQGVKAGLFRPITLWPFPIDRLAEFVPHARGFVVVEAGSGQLEDEVRLAMSHAGLALPEMAHVRRCGGVLPSKKEIMDRILSLEEVHHGHGVL